MKKQAIVDRFDGRIIGAGSTSGVRIVIGDWLHSPLGNFTDVMVATADDQRVLLAPSQQVADYVTATYNFDEVVLVDVRFDGRQLDAGPLQAAVDVGRRTGTGFALRSVPKPLGRSRFLAVVADPIARRVHPGVRTYGTAGNGRREYYSALDQFAVTAISGTWHGRDLGYLADVDPPPRFGFSSTPRRPSWTQVTTTIVRPPG